jgi:hypothetical protein
LSTILVRLDFRIEFRSFGQINIQNYQKSMKQIYRFGAKFE